MDAARTPRPTLPGAAYLPAGLLLLLGGLVLWWGANSFHDADDYHHLREARTATGLADLVVGRYQTWSPRIMESVMIWLTSVLSPGAPRLGHDRWGLFAGAVLVGAVVALARRVQRAARLERSAMWWWAVILLAGLASSGYLDEAVFWQSASYCYLVGPLCLAGALALWHPTGDPPAGRGGRSGRFSLGAILYVVAVNSHEFLAFVYGPLAIVGMVVIRRFQKDGPNAGQLLLLGAALAGSLAIYLSCPGALSRLQAMAEDRGSGWSVPDGRVAAELLASWARAYLGYALEALPFALALGTVVGLGAAKGQAPGASVASPFLAAGLLLGGGFSILFWFILQLHSGARTFWAGPIRVESMWYASILLGMAVLAGWASVRAGPAIEGRAGGALSAYWIRAVLLVAAAAVAATGFREAAAAVVHTSAIRRQLAERLAAIRSTASGGTASADAWIAVPRLVYVPDALRRGLQRPIDLWVEPPAGAYNISYAEFVRGELDLPYTPRIRPRAWYEDDPSGRAVAAVFWECLGRWPDITGREWVMAFRRGEISLRQIVLQVLVSDELARRRARGEQPTAACPGAEQAVVRDLEALYGRLLRRRLDPGGVDLFGQALLDGRLTLPDVEAAVRASPEYQAMAEVPALP